MNFNVENRQDTWRLTIHWYPKAAEAGVQPFVDQSYDAVVSAGAYHPHDFDFINPPSRQDFVEVCKRYLPWTHVWKDTLLKLIEDNRCDWPMIDSLHKGSTAYIHDEQGRKIGRLEVWKHTMFVNRPYSTHYIPCKLRDQLIRGYKGEARKEVYDFIEKNENRIREALAAYDRPFEMTDVANEIKKVIEEWKRHRKQLGAL